MSVITAETALTPHLRDVLAAWRGARHEMEMLLGVATAGAVVEGMHRGAWPRRGTLPDGVAYFGRGIGYTVVLPDGGQVHLDASDGGDSFTVSDLMMFFRTSQRPGGGDPPSARALEKALKRIAADGSVRQLAPGKYLLQ